MTRAVAAALAAALAACGADRPVRLDLRLDGFVCTGDDGAYLVRDAVVGDQFVGQVVVDVITLGGRFPGCLGEDIVDGCVGGACFTAARACRTVMFPISDDPDVVRARFLDALSGWAPIADAPDGAVVVRAVATTQPCDAIDQATDGRFPRLDGDAAVGCAYSCPTVLDEVDQVTLGIGFVLGDQCEQFVRGCAGAL